MVGITAPRAFSPGEVIYTFEPFVEFLCREFKDEACEQCFDKVANLKSCKECLSVKYCGKSCQKKNWKSHKLECKKLKNLPTENFLDVDKIRLLGNIILIIKGKDWKTIKSGMLGVEVSFDDIELRLEEITGNQLQKLRFNAVKKCVRRYIGDENMPNDDDFGKIYGKVMPYFCTGTTLNSDCGSVCFSIGFSIMQRECIPNCYVTAQGNSWKMWAFKKINKSEKLSICSRNILSSPPREEVTAGSCSCSDCSLPYGESVLSKITDEQRAVDIIIATQQFLTMWHCYPFVQGIPLTEITVHALLEKQEGVLGDTNALHLKLLFIQCLEIGGHPLAIKKGLLKLEKIIVSVFGEYFPEMKRVYKALADVYFAQGNFMVAFSYMKKAEKIESYELQ